MESPKDLYKVHCYFQYIYIKDLFNVIRNCSLYLYADDTVLVANATDVYDTHLHLQRDMNNVVNWCNGNKLSVNILKKV